MINVRRLGHATLMTPDLGRQVEYYLQHVGLSLVHRDEKRAVLATRVGQESIVLEQGSTGALTGLAFQVPPGTDLATLQRDLDGKGVHSELKSDTTPGIDRVLVFEDPKGTQIEIFSDYRFQGFDKSTQGVMPQKLGHVAFRTTNIQAVLRFYIDVLGFRISDSRGDNFYFLRCSPDHHTVNFLADDKVELHHFAFELKDWGEIHRGCELLAREGIHQSWGPGRHVIGHNIACYHHNADNLMVELYTEMDQMKDEALGYFEPRPWHQDFPQWPKVWGPETLRNYWGFGSERPQR